MIPRISRNWFRINEGSMLLKTSSLSLVLPYILLMGCNLAKQAVCQIKPFERPYIVRSIRFEVTLGVSCGKGTVVRGNPCLITHRDRGSFLSAPCGCWSREVARLHGDRRITAITRSSLRLLGELQAAVQDFEQHQPAQDPQADAEQGSDQEILGEAQRFELRIAGD